MSIATGKRRGGGLRFGLISAVVFAAAVARGQAPVRLVTGDAQSAVTCGTTVYFQNNYDLWKTDGSTTGTMLVRSVQAKIDRITCVGDYAFFRANDNQLWRTDGTWAGTILLKEFRQSNNWYTLENLTAYNGKLYCAGDDGVNGVELWRSDGTVAGTYMLKDINPQPTDPDYWSRAGWSWPMWLTEYNGLLYFAAADGVHGNLWELWRTDGTAAGTVLVADINPYGFSTPAYMAATSAGLLFSADDGTSGTELWITDGTFAGTRRVKDIVPGGGSSNPYYLHVWNDRAYFWANDGVHGQEMWGSNGTTAGTLLLKDIYPGSAWGIFNPFLANTPSWLAFSANDGTHGEELWISDGTDAGTRMVKDINPGSGSGGANYTVPIGNAIYFVGYDGVHGSEVWTSDGTDAGTTMVADLNSGTSYWDDPRYLTVLGARLVFYESTALWRYDTCAAPAAPSSAVASRSATNTVTVSWPPVSGATIYNVYRSALQCPGGNFVSVGQTASTSYVDSLATDPGPYSYKVTAVNATGCESVPSSCAVDACTVPTRIYLDGFPFACLDGNGGTVTAIDGGDPLTTYSWGYSTVSGGTVTPIAAPSTTTYTIRGVDFPGAGRYYLTCTATPSCGTPLKSDELAVDVYASTLPDPAITLGYPDICPSGPGYASGPAGYATYQWSVTNGSINGASNQRWVNFTSDGKGTMAVTLNVTASGTCVGTKTVNVPLRSLPQPTLSAYPNAICPGSYGSAQVTNTSAYTSPMYWWTVQNGVINGSANNAYVNFQSNGLSEVVATVTVSTPDGCQVSNSITIPYKTLSATIEPNSASLCPDGYGSAHVVEPFDTISWSITNGSISGPTTGQWVNFIVNSSGTAELRAVASTWDGCTTTSYAYFTVKPATAPEITTPAEVCPSASATASVPSTHSNYSWSITNGTIDSGSTSPTVSFTAGPSGVVTLSVTVDQGTCWQATASKDVASCIPEPVASFVTRSTNGANLLMWANPSAGVYESTMVRVRTDGTYPTGPTDGQLVGTISGVIGGVGSFTHSLLDNDVVYRYAAFARSSTGHYSTYMLTPGRPQATNGPVKWVYNTGVTAMTPPGLNGGAIYAVSNDRILHSMRVASSGGDWPAGWRPPLMNGPSQARPVVAPMTVNQINGAAKVAFVGSQDGYVYALNASTGAELWSTQIGEAVQAAPSGAFRQYGSTLTGIDLILAGTRNTFAPNGIVALNTQGGGIVWSYTGDGPYKVGIISGQPSVDTVNRRIYFTNRAASGTANENHTVWCLSYNETSATRLWSVPVGDIDGSPLLRNNTLFLGTNQGTIYALNPSDGSVLASYLTGDGPVKGFVFVDGASIYFSTTNKVWRLIDNQTTPRTLSLGWSISSIASPSIAVMGGTSLYTGSSDGKLYRLSALTTATPTMTSVTLGDGTAAVGAIGWDSQNGLAYVGTAAGAIYAVVNP